MKLSVPLVVFTVLPFVAQASAGVFPRQRNRGGNRNGGGDAGGGAGAGGANNSTGTGGGGNNNNDPQTSLTLDPAVIAQGFANDGQDVPADGQVPSLTSTNNFINFCLTVPDLPITNGKQIQTGSCNPAPIGAIPSTDRMPSSKFTFPKNGDTIPSDQAFTISMAIKNLQTGAFVNAQSNYFAAPQQLNGQGTIIGHSHVVVELLDSVDQTTPTDPKKFAFFKGLNAAAANGILTADVSNGLPAGAYRLCSINAAANHQPAIVAVAQHGSLDDCVYFTASPGGAAAGGADGAAGGDGNTGAGAGGADGAAGGDGNTGAGAGGADGAAGSDGNTGAGAGGADGAAGGDGNTGAGAGGATGGGAGTGAANGGGGTGTGNTGGRNGGGRGGRNGNRRGFIFARAH